MYSSSYWDDFFDPWERNVGSKCMCTPPSFLWSREVRAREETVLFLFLLLKQTVLLSSLSSKKFSPSNKVHRFTQKWLSSLTPIGCCWHMLKATLRGKTDFFICQNSTVKWFCLSQQGIFPLGPSGFRGHRQNLVESPVHKGLKFFSKI